MSLPKLLQKLPALLLLLFAAEVSGQAITGTSGKAIAMATGGSGQSTTTPAPNDKDSMAQVDSVPDIIADSSYHYYEGSIWTEKKAAQPAQSKPAKSNPAPAKNDDTDTPVPQQQSRPARTGIIVMPDSYDFFTPFMSGCDLQRSRMTGMEERTR